MTTHPAHELAPAVEVEGGHDLEGSCYVFVHVLVMQRADDGWPRLVDDQRRIADDSDSKLEVSQPGRYAMVSAPAGAVPGVMHLDTATGDLRYCVIGPRGSLCDSVPVAL